MCLTDPPHTRLFFAKVPDCRNQGGAARRFMPFVGDCHIVDDVTRTTFGNLAVVVSFNRTTACIADACDRFAIDREVVRAYADDLAAVRRRVPETNDVGHRSSFLFGGRFLTLAADSIVRRTVRGDVCFRKCLRDG